MDFLSTPIRLTTNCNVLPDWPIYPSQINISQLTIYRGNTFSVNYSMDTVTLNPLNANYSRSL